MSRKAGHGRRPHRPAQPSRSAAPSAADRGRLVDELLDAVDQAPWLDEVAEEFRNHQEDPATLLEMYDEYFRLEGELEPELLEAIREIAKDSPTAFRAEAHVARFIAGFVVADEAQRLDRAEQSEADDAAEATEVPSDEEDSFTGLLLHLSVTEPETAVLALARATESVGRPDQREAARVAAARLRLAGVAEPKWSRSIGRPTFAGAFQATAEGDDTSTVVLHFEYSHRLHALVALIDSSDWAEGGIKSAYAVEVADDSELRQSDLVEGADLQELSQEQAAAVIDAAFEIAARPSNVDQADSLLDTIPLLVARRRIMEPARPDVIAPLIRLDEVADLPPEAVYRLKATAKGSRPSVWRELVVDTTNAIMDLHQILEISFDLEGGLDPWVFEYNGDRFGIVGDDFVQIDLELADLELQPGDRIRWTAADASPIDIEVLAVEDPQDGVGYPFCADGGWVLPARPGEEQRHFRRDLINEELAEWMAGEPDDHDHSDAG